MLTTPATITAAEYLAAERNSPERHEFFNGESLRMGGASRAHSLINTSLAVRIGNALLDEDYAICSINMRMRSPVGSYFYPDLVITAGEAQLEDDQCDTLLNPVLVIEVLSPGTESYDRGDKALAYRQIPSLREYLIVAQDEPVVEHWVRLAEHKWQVAEIRGLNATLRLLDGLCEIKLADVYRKVLPKG